MLFRICLAFLDIRECVSFQCVPDVVQCVTVFKCLGVAIPIWSKPLHVVAMCFNVLPCFHVSFSFVLERIARLSAVTSVCVLCGYLRCFGVFVVIAFALFVPIVFVLCCTSAVALCLMAVLVCYDCNPIVNISIKTTQHMPKICFLYVSYKATNRALA